ncbi:MAG TPA: histidine phosphatase family protein [Kiloniellaceae bacterium]|nr:histidine phosphatase family protein [Kiloniellaceae bacterium]
MIYLLRHGQTVWNSLGLYQGRQDSPLTARGIAQAQMVGRKLAEVTAGQSDLKVIASPLGRAWQTAVIVAETLSLKASEIILEPRIAEVAYGAWEGLSGAEAARRFPEDWAAREADKWNHPVPGGESYAQVAARLMAWTAELERDRPHVVVGHGAAGRILRGLYLNMSPVEIFALEEPQDAFFRLQEGSVTRFDATEQALV